MPSLKRSARHLTLCFRYSWARPCLLYFNYPSSLDQFPKHYFSYITKCFSPFRPFVTLPCYLNLSSSFFEELVPSQFSGFIFNVISSGNFPTILSKSCLYQYAHVNLTYMVFSLHNSMHTFNCTCVVLFCFGVLLVVHYASLIRLRTLGG